VSQPEVTIHRCRLRIVRRGGWSWGHDPRMLTRAALEGLPALLAEKLGELAVDGEDVELTSPVQIRMRLKLADLYRFAQESGRPGAAGEAIGRQIAESIQTVLADHRRSNASDRTNCVSPLVSVVGANDSGTTAQAAQQTAAAQPGRALLQLLCDWDTNEDLGHRISTLPQELLEQWLERLLETWTFPASATVEEHEARVRSICERTRELQVLVPPGRHRQLVRALALLVRLSVAGGVDRRRVEELLAEHVPLETNHAAQPNLRFLGGGSQAQQAATAAGPARAQPGWPLLLPAQPIVTDTVPAEFICDIPCALPFLMLVPLARVGYLSALSAALDAGRAATLAHALGASLARKSLKPPERGWHRLPAEQTTAACCAGRKEAVPDTDIVSALYSLRTQWPLLDQFVSANLIAGHRNEAAWILAHDMTGALVLFDSDGCFPVATGSAHQLAVLAAPSGSRVLMAAELAKSPVAEALESLQIRYRVCDDERWEEAVASWNAILIDRPALPRGTHLPGESSLALAASLALGSISWTLWRELEPVHPLLAIERFHDFDARVHVTSDAVHVRLPLGKRFWHLRDEGLLGTVSDVPWLPGRAVHFGAS
jgi:hypothetical protein